MNRAPAERAEVSQRIADRHHGERVDVLRDVEQGLYLLFAADMVGGDGCAQAECAAGKDDVLHRRIDARPSNTRNVALFVCKTVVDLGRQYRLLGQTSSRLAWDH